MTTGFVGPIARDKLIKWLAAHGVTARVEDGGWTFVLEDAAHIAVLQAEFQGETGMDGMGNRLHAQDCVRLLATFFSKPP